MSNEREEKGISSNERIRGDYNYIDHYSGFAGSSGYLRRYLTFQLMQFCCFYFGNSSFTTKIEGFSAYKQKQKQRHILIQLQLQIEIVRVEK
jgi:hypothetical protein